MQKFICDKCGKELREDQAIEVEIGGKTHEYFDLCEECREKLIDWLAGVRRPPCKTEKADEEDRLYEGPENDKNAYTIYQLEKTLHKYRGAVKKALSGMKKEPSAWMLKGRPVVKWFLGEDDMKELKKRLGVK